MALFPVTQISSSSSSLSSLPDPQDVTLRASTTALRNNMRITGTFTQPLAVTWMPKGINGGQSCLESVEGAKGSYHPLPHSEHLPRARERISEEREGKRKAATTAAEVDPQLQGLRLTTSRGKGTWVDRKQLNPVTGSISHPDLALQRKRVASRGP